MICVVVSVSVAFYDICVEMEEGADILLQCSERMQQIEEKTEQLKRASIAEGTLGRYSKNFKHWESFCTEFGFPVWIDKLPRAQQARMVGLFVELCASEGHNRSDKGNIYQTSDRKMAAVAFAHKVVRNARIDYHDPEFELIAQGYKRSKSSGPEATGYYTDVAQDAGTPRRTRPTGHTAMGIDRLRMLRAWGPVTIDNSTGLGRTHCIKATNVILRDNQGHQVKPEGKGIHSVEVVFQSHKGDRIGQGVTIRHYKSDNALICPVETSRRCLSVRGSWEAEGKKLGPYLTSIPRTKTLKKSQVADIIKAAAASMGQTREDYSTHSPRIGGACALVAAGKSDLVIRLMGRWTSWCFTVYTRLRPRMIRDAASCMIKASTWEWHEPGFTPNQISRHLGGTLASLTPRAKQDKLPLTVISRRRKVCIDC
ncbi:Hypothetical protein PHPALM_14603 [Phytophthora palmivora]|uniref:Tyr recombinase domain-containing protein n=1 Tax=Phytophthora palmivora TaxID=4796 RepID=A0A2P4XUD5_9STRA|nr:Hypothetical protein PHPALM_14603 [Phytophthora palmivora]